MSKYDYTKQVDVPRLTQEIQQSNIVTALDYISALGTAISIYFKADLSTEDKTTLDTIVANHSGLPLPVNVVKPVLISNTINEALPSASASPLNIHCMEPWGSAGGYFEPRGATKYVCNITLSNPSTDGLTFTYNEDVDIVPTIGNYVFQQGGTVKSWITSIDAVNHTLTFERPNLAAGAGIYSKGMYVDCIVREWAPVMYIWGMTFNVLEYLNDVLETDPCPDFCELSVVDLDDMWKTDEVCMAVLGVPAADAGPILTANKWEINHEYGEHWTKYYDESWIANFNGKYTRSTDGAPGGAFPGLYFRFSLFTTEVEDNKVYKVLLDYAPTSIPTGSN